MRGWLLNLNRRDSFELLELLGSSSFVVLELVLDVQSKIEEEDEFKDDNKPLSLPPWPPR